MSNKVYDILKIWVLPILTGGATFIITLGELWHIPYSKEMDANVYEPSVAGWDEV